MAIIQSCHAINKRLNPYIKNMNVNFLIHGEDTA